MFANWFNYLTISLKYLTINLFKCLCYKNNKYTLFIAWTQRVTFWHIQGYVLTSRHRYVFTFNRGMFWWDARLDSNPLLTHIGVRIQQCVFVYKLNNYYANNKFRSIFRRNVKQVPLNYIIYTCMVS